MTPLPYTPLAEVFLKAGVGEEGQGLPLGPALCVLAAPINRAPFTGSRRTPPQGTGPSSSWGGAALDAHGRSSASWAGSNAHPGGSPGGIRGKLHVSPKVQR